MIIFHFKVVSHDTRKFRFALQSPEHILGLPVGMSCEPLFSFLVNIRIVLLEDFEPFYIGTYSFQLESLFSILGECVMCSMFF